MSRKIKFNILWFQDDKIGEWISEVQNEPTRALCTFCGISLSARYSHLLEHAKTKRHAIAKVEAVKQGKRVKDTSFPVSTESRTPIFSKARPKKQALSKFKKKPTNTHKSSEVESSDSYIYVEDFTFQPTGHSILPISEEPTDFCVSTAPDMPTEHSAIPLPSESVEFLPSDSTTMLPSRRNPFYSYYREESDDLNYLFGLCVGAGLKKCSEEQAAIARLKIQTIMHQATFNELQL